MDDIVMMKIDLLKGREIVDRLGGRVAYSTLMMMAAGGLVPSYRIGKRGRRFVLGEVIEAMRRLAAADARAP